MSVSPEILAKLMNLEDGQVLYNQLQNEIYDLVITIAPPYETLHFPISEGTACFHDGKLYIAARDIETQEEFTLSHWDQIMIGPMLSNLDNGIQVTVDAIHEIVSPHYKDLTFPVHDGQYCIYHTGLYCANRDIPQYEDWTPGHWDKVSVGGQLEAITNTIIEISNLIAPRYEDLSFPVFEGTFCQHNGSLWQANQDISTSEPWTPRHWEQRWDVGNVLDSIIQDYTILGNEVDSLKNIVEVSDTEPTDSNNKLWIEEDAEEEITLPTYAEHTALMNALSKSSENTNIAISAHPVGDLFWYNGTLHVATSAIAVGDTIVDTGTGANCKDTTISEALIKDIQINGTSILQNGVANVPIASSSNLGVVKTLSDLGTAMTNNGIVSTYPATDANIKSAGSAYRPIVPSNQHKSIFYGLSKLAGVDLASLSGETVGVYPDAAKVAIQKMLGIYQAPWELIREDTFTNATEADHTITVDGNGQAFELTDVVLLFDLPKVEEASSKTDDRFSFYYSNNYAVTTSGGTMTRNAGGNAVGTWQVVEQRNGMVFTQQGARTTTTNNCNISYRYHETNPAGNGIYLPSSPLIFTRINIPRVTGTGHYKLYGRRKWTA